MSPYAQSLIDRMRNSPTEIERAKAEILLGCYWARVGDQAAAEEIRQRSREAYPSGRFGEITILHMCLDGLMHFYTDQSPAAVERLRSAHTLAATYRFRSEQAFCAAWLAHVEFNRDHWQSTVESLRSGFASVDSSDVATVGRLVLVTADALMHSGESQTASLWYECARTQFTSIGDHAAIEAFLYNGAALRIHAARLDAIGSPIDVARLIKLGGEISSATNYQRITQQRSLDYLLLAAAASHQMLLAKFSEASAMIRKLLEEGAIPKSSSAGPLLKADLALCCAQNGGSEDGVLWIERAVAASDEVTSQDDMAVVAHSIASACAALGLEAEAAHWFARRDSALHDFRITQATLRTALAEWLTDPRSILASAK